MLVENNTSLNILLPNDNKVLTEALKEADSKIIEQFAKNNISINDVLKNLFDDLKNGIKSDSTIENILKNSSMFKEMGNFSNLLSSLVENLSKEENPNLEKFKPLLENFLKNIKDLDANSLKEQIKNSGIFLESKIAQKYENFNEDVKSILLKMQEDLSSKTDVKSQELSKQVDKLLSQLDFQQLLSITSNSNSVYLPFFWEMMDDGKISMKKSDEEKFFCQINLSLKNFGKVDLMLALYDKNKLDLTIYTQKEDFKTSIRDNMQKLKIALNNVDLIPVNIKLLDLKDEKKEEPINIYDNYNKNINFNFIDIKA